MLYILMIIVLFTVSAIVEQNIDDKSRSRELKWCGIAFVVWSIVFIFTI